MSQFDLGAATLRILGDRSDFDRKMAEVARAAAAAGRQGVKIPVEADTSGAVRNLQGLNALLAKLGQASTGNFDGLTQGLSQAGEAGAGAAGGLGAASGAMGGLMGGAMKAIPILGQLGLAAMGLKAIFQGLAGMINAAVAPLEALSAASGRFNQQVSKGSVFASRAYNVSDAEGNIVEKTSAQMRALRPVVTREFAAIQKEVAEISGATAEEIQEGFNIILQNAGSLGTAANDLSNVTKLATRTAAAMNTLGIPAQQLRSEMMSLMTGNVQVYDELGKSLGYTSEKIKELQAQGGTAFYDDLIKNLDKLYEGQKVMAESLSNVKSNYVDFFQSVGAQGGQRLEAGLAGGMQSVLDQLSSLQLSFTTVFDSMSVGLEPILRILGQVGAAIVPIVSVVLSSISVIFSALGPLLNLLNAVLAPILEVIIGVLNVMATNAQRTADVFNRLMRPLNAFLGAFAAGDTNSIRDFFADLNKRIGETTQLVEGLIERWTKLMRGFAERQANIQAMAKGLTGEKKEEFVQERLADFDRRAAYDAGYTYQSNMLSAPTKQVIDEIQQKNQGFMGLLGGTGGRTVNGISSTDVARAKEVAEVKQKMYENEIRGLEQGLKLMQAQKSLVQAMAELTENRRKIDMARAGFGVQLAGSPEVRLNAETAQRELVNRQEQDRLRERREMLQVERDIQARQAQIQERQAQIQAAQMNILKLEATLARDRVQAAIEDAEAQYAKRGRTATGAWRSDPGLEGRIKQLRTELTYRQDILVQADRAVELSAENERIGREVAGVEQQRLSVQEQQLDVLAEQNMLTAEQGRILDDIKAAEQELNREREQAQQMAAKGKADLEDRIKAMEREQTAIDEQVKTAKVLGELAQARAKLETEAAERALKVAQAREGAAGSGSSIRDIIGAEVQALAAGQEGMTSVADATKRLYDAKERQLLQEQEMARAQQKAQQEREQSEMRIAALRIRVQQIELAGQLAQQRIALEQARQQVRRDELSNQVQAQVTAGTGQGATVGGVANMLPGTKGGPNWNEGFGYSARRGRNHGGLDLGLDVGDPIHSRQDGVVEQLIEKFGKVGGAVVIKYDDGTAGLYGHTNPSVRPGQAVKAGDRIATVTNDGQNTHLHYELFDRNGNRVDPASAVRQSLAVPAGQRSGGTAAPAAPALPAPAGTPTAGRGNNRQVAMDYLVQRLGLTPAQAAGVVGNLMQESTAGLNPRINYGGAVGLPQGSGPYGIAQWRGSRLTDLTQFAGGAEKSGDLMTQLAFMVHELQGKESPALRSLKGAQSAEQAAVVFERDYERADGSGLANRQAFARTALSEYRPGAAQLTGATTAGTAAAPPATGGLQAVAGAEQSIGILEQQLGSLAEVLKQFEDLLAGLTGRQAIERDTLATQQQGQIGNLRMDRTEAIVIQQALGGQKAQFMADVADTYGGWMSGAIKGALQQARQTGELDLADFAKSIMGGLADRLIEMSVDYVMAPIEAQMKKAIFGNLTGIDDEKLKEMVRQEQASQGQLQAAQMQQRAADTMLQATGGATAGLPGQEALPATPGALETLPDTGGPRALEVLPFDGSAPAPANIPLPNTGLPGATVSPFSQGFDFNFETDFKALDGAFDNLLGGTMDLGTTFKDGAAQSGQNLNGLQQGFGSALAGLASLGMVFGGIQQIKEGGTGNVIGGIGSILGGVGSFLLGPGAGLFGGARAGGGQANAGQRLLVGENGPELFDVPANGSIRSNGELRSAMGSGGSGGRGGGMSLAMSFQTTKFMDREWVDRDQLEEAMQRAERNGAREGARQGEQRTIERLKQSPRTRREIGF